MKNKKEFIADFAYLMAKYYEPFEDIVQADNALTDVLNLLKEKYGISK